MSNHLKVTEWDLRDVAKAIREGRVKRNVHDRDMVEFTTWRSIRKGYGLSMRVERVAYVRNAFCFTKTSVLEDRGYAVLGDGGVWELTTLGETWLDSFDAGAPVETRMKDEGRGIDGA